MNDKKLRSIPTKRKPIYHLQKKSDCFPLRRKKILNCLNRRTKQWLRPKPKDNFKIFLLSQDHLNIMQTMKCIMAILHHISGPSEDCIKLGKIFE